MSALSEAPCRVHVTDEARVVERGERLRVWFIRLRDGWVRAHEHPDAATEAVSGESGGEACPPGTIWLRNVELVLSRGSVLLSRVTEPQLEHLEPLEYLKRGKMRLNRAMTESYYVVTGNYRLSPLKERPTSFPPPPGEKKKKE